MQMPTLQSLVLYTPTNMALVKQAIPINFAQGLDTKTDPNQVAPGNFLDLENTIFGIGKLMQKRNGFGALTPLPDASAKLVTTFNGNLTAIGTSLQAFSNGAKLWSNKGQLQPISLDTLPLVRSNTNQSQADSALSPSGLVCTAFTDNIPNGGSTTPVLKYTVADATTGQNIIPITAITSAGATAVNGSPRVFVLGNYFVIVFNALITGTNHLQYIAINSVNTSIITAATSISLSYTPNSLGNFDGVVANNNLYLAWNGADIGNAVRITYVTHALAQANTVVFPGSKADIMSVTADVSGTTPVIYATFQDTGTTNGHTLAVNQTLLTLLAPTQIITTTNVNNIVTVATNGLVTILYEVLNAYGYDSSIQTDYINKTTITSLGVTGPTSTVLRSVGLASKAFILNDQIYVMAIYSSPFQPTNFLINQDGQVIARLAYSNAGGYYTTGLPSVTISGSKVSAAYLIKDSIQAVNKSQGNPNPTGIYSQTGINLVTFDLGFTNISTSEIGNNLNISGGFVWAYDGYQPVEQNFFVWPDSVEATWSATGGNIPAKPDSSTNINAYFYQVTYEWSDNQGNVFRSAPSIPVAVTTTGTGVIGSITVNIPTLRLTYKINNPVKIVVYRWSLGQQNYYQTTLIQNPTLNDTTVDSITFVDTHSDAQILGNNLIYTTGGVLEDIAPPATDSLTLFNSRLWLIDSEDRNLLWYSKQVIEATPVEMSDLLTIFVAPTVGVNGSTGVMTALSAMDDKLIIFKRDAAYYLNGIGPDNTGSSSQYSDPVFITATVGCANQDSIVFMPNGLMFQSDKGIWLLNRSLSTEYIGAPVEKFTKDALVKSALSIPGTNQVRFTLDSGIILIYDYFYGQWGTFTNIPAISSTLYQGLNTYVNRLGQVFQETPGKFIDGSAPVQMRFTTGWMNLAGLQGFERAYMFFLLANYLSPHRLSVQIAYDYAPSASQVVTINPDNFSPAWGSDPLYGDSPVWGGASSLEQWRIFFSQQKCQAFQISIQEMFDPSFGTAPGAGFTMSGLDLVVGLKKGYTPKAAKNSAG